MAALLAMAFILPNHYFPWSSFHAEALAAVAIAIPAIWISLRFKESFRLYVSNVIIYIAIIVALVQYGLGLIPFFGTFWICAAYLLGFSILLQIGDVWERVHPGQCMDYLSMAFIIAAMVSLPLEFMQWLDMSWETPLIMHVPNIQRPFANMAQPNLLADLYLLAVIGVSWLYEKNYFSSVSATFLAAAYLVGAALTGSRAAWINVFVLLVYATLLKPKQNSIKHLRACVLLAIFFFVCANAGPKIQNLLLSRDGLDVMRQFSVDSTQSRLAVWKMMFLASLLSPVWGYGWGQVIKVNFVFEDAKGVEPGLFSQSHNFFLDLVLWNGYPLGVFFALLLVWWIWRLIHLERDSSNWHIQIAILILCVHSLIEFPLYYTYFLFPSGLMLGSRQARIFEKMVLQGSAHVHRFILVIGLVILAVSIRDYFLIERNFYALRFESRGYLTDVPKAAPNGWALTQLVEHMRFSRSEAYRGATPVELQNMENIVRVTPGAYIMFKLAVNYGLNENTDRAKFWLKQICYKSFADQCDIARENWKRAEKKQTTTPLMPWPLP